MASTFGGGFSIWNMRSGQLSACKLPRKSMHGHASHHARATLLIANTGRARLALAGGKSSLVHLYCAVTWDLLHTVDMAIPDCQPKP